MRLLLDTQIVYWTYYEAARLPSEARRLMIAADEIRLSSVSIWELAIKAKLGKIDADPAMIVEKTNASGFIELPMTHRHVLGVTALPLLHGDPFDRLLIAQSFAEGLRLLTTDSRLPQYGASILQV